MQVFRSGFILACSLLSVLTTSSQSYTFTTLAGSAAYNSADGAGTNARFCQPFSVAVDKAGILYVADGWNHTIRKMTPDGMVSTLAGLAGASGSADGAGSTARFCAPSGVAVDGAGNVYVADSNNHTIRKVTSTGVVSTVAGLAESCGSADGTGSNARFLNPSGVAVDAAGNVYVTDSGNNTIRKITPEREVSTLAGLAGTIGSGDAAGNDARFNGPFGVAVDTAGCVYVADSWNYTIRKITPAGAVSTLAGMAGATGSEDGTGTAARFYCPRGITVDGAGNLFVVDSWNSTIRKITFNGMVSTLAGLAGVEGSDDGAGSEARFYAPYGVAVDSLGAVFVADTYNDLIRKVTCDGTVTTLAGLSDCWHSDDGVGNKARFNSPMGVAVDRAGNLFVADTWNSTIRKITPNREVSTVAGLAGCYASADGQGTNACFDRPQGIAVDLVGNLYVADTRNHTIRKITLAGLVSTLAGLAGNSGSDDGPGSTARFTYPWGLAVDSGGTVFVADSGNHTIRKITPAGVVSTLAGLAESYGSEDGAGSSARFCNPSGLAVDTVGTVYVADGGNCTIRKITADGVVSTLAGLAPLGGSTNGVGADARFYTPCGVALDRAGNVLVVEEFNFTVRQVTPAGVVSTLAGLAGFWGSAEGVGSTVRFNIPCGIAVDPRGNIYVADSWNYCIRVGWAAPPLFCRPATNHLVLSWPLAASNCVLETSSTLSPNSSWAPLTNAVGVEGDTFAVTNSLDAPVQFFRLRRP